MSSDRLRAGAEHALHPFPTIWRIVSQHTNSRPEQIAWFAIATVMVGLRGAGR